MGRSSLSRTGEQKTRVGVGHGTGALGPSDTSDSGSDVQGGPGVGFEPEIPLLQDAGKPGGTAGPDIGDAKDIGTDRVFTVPEAQAEGSGGAAQPDGSRDFSDRRPGRGNRLRRGLRSRRKTFRQR